MPDVGYKIMNTKYDANQLRNLLLTEQGTRRIADDFLKRALDELKNEVENREVFRVLSFGIETIISRSVQIIHKHAQSEIEKVFLSSLMLCFLKADPGNLLFTPPFKNAPEEISNFRDFHKFCLDLDDKYHKSSAYSNGQDLDSFLDRLVTEKQIDDADKMNLLTHLMLYHQCNFINRIHLTPQAGFPNIKVNGQSIRADILIWVPGNEAFNLIVECDGFEFHKEKNSFIKDRKRDRAFLSKGFRVQRYSGTEILHDPIGVSTELFEFLMKEQNNSTQQKNPADG